MNALSSLYSIVMDCEINASGHGNNFVDGLNTSDKIHLK